MRRERYIEGGPRRATLAQLRVRVFSSGAVSPFYCERRWLNWELILIVYTLSQKPVSGYTFPNNRLAARGETPAAVELL